MYKNKLDFHMDASHSACHNVIWIFLLWIYKSLNLNIFSDLREPGLVPGKSLSLSAKINSV